jgi:hypothetical protein
MSNHLRQPANLLLFQTTARNDRVRQQAGFVKFIVLRTFYIT